MANDSYGTRPARHFQRVILKMQWRADGRKETAAHQASSDVAMKVFLDTNVLIAAAIKQHPHFTRADEAIRRCVDDEDTGFIHAHSLLEFHSAVTQLPKGLAVPPGRVPSLIDEGILPFVRLVSLDAKRIVKIETQAGEMGLVGGIIYDLYLLAAAEDADVDRLLTFNVAHFQRIARPEFVSRIVAP